MAKKVFIVSYDLIDDESDEHYERVIDVIKEQGDAEEIQKSVWIVASSRERKKIRDNIEKELDSSDKIFVGELTGCAYRNLPKKAKKIISKTWD